MKKATVESVMPCITSLVLLKLSVSFWTGRVQKQKTAREVEKERGTAEGRMDVFVRNLPKEHEHALGTAVSQLRAFWYLNTLPWEDGGWRVCPAAAYTQLMDDVVPFIRKCQDAFDALFRDYAKVKAAARKALNGEWDEAKFPTLDDLKAKYGVDIMQGAITNPKDGRIEGLSDEQNKFIRESAERAMADRYNGAVMSMVETIREVAADAKTRMGKKKQKGIRYGGMIETAAKTVKALKRLANITADPKIGRMLEELEAALVKQDAEALRDDPAARTAAKAKVVGVMDALDTFMG